MTPLQKIEKWIAVNPRDRVLEISLENGEYYASVKDGAYDCSIRASASTLDGALERVVAQIPAAMTPKAALALLACGPEVRSVLERVVRQHTAALELCDVFLSHEGEVGTTNEHIQEALRRVLTEES